ncbi:MAG: response regulator transcription factor [Kiloniellales bacterium]|nr:response regulator transcription factor [Kiloniellales bacterium]
MQHTGSAGTILIVEDDRNIANLVAKYLDKDGFESSIIYDGREVLSAIQNLNPSLMVLDLMLPGLDGWEICREVRKISDLPILILTARDDEMDRVVGLSIGADDYVVKPFSPRELVERVKAILRRVRSSMADTKSEDDILQCGPLTLEPLKHKVSLNGENVALTRSEYKLLHCLMAAPGRVFTRAQLLDRLYSGGETVVDRVVDVHIGKLRQKIERDPSNPYFIHTVHGVGYRFNEEAR